MKCTACGNALEEVTIEGITVDVCKEGCGGIWFDAFELKKVDEKHESAGEALLSYGKKEKVTVDRSKRHPCPKCPDMPMMRHFFSVKQAVEVDECPKCAGFWLDAGELTRIRDLFENEEEKKKAAEEYYDEIFGTQLSAMRDESEEKLSKAGKIAHMFRFICPSYYIPGKQDGAAF